MINAINAHMNELLRVVKGLESSRPSIDLEQLMALESPSAEFEAHIPAEQGRDFWVYTVNGNLLDGEVMVVRASLPNQAEAMAQEGLHETIEGLRRFDVNTGLHIEAEVKGVE